MKHDFVASKLLEGRACVTARTAWWPRHSQLTLTRFEAEAKGKSAAQKECDKTLVSLAHEWDALLGRLVQRDGLLLMREHTEIERRLMHAALDGDSDVFLLAYKQLVENGRLQTEFFSSAIPDFPVCTFGDGLRDHNESTIQVVTSHLERHPKTEKVARQLNARASLSLARISGEWLS